MLSLISPQSGPNISWKNWRPLQFIKHSITNCWNINIIYANSLVVPCKEGCRGYYLCNHIRLRVLRKSSFLDNIKYKLYINGLALTSSALNLKVDVVWKGDFIRNISTITEQYFLVRVGQDGKDLEGHGVGTVGGNLNWGFLQSNGRSWQKVDLYRKKCF